MGRIERLPQAVDDVLTIWDHIAVDNFNRDAADRWLVRLDEVLQLLSQQPEMGSKQDAFSPGLRSFSVGEYVLFYRPLIDGVRLIRVLHGARQFKDLL
jgi:toxin ParE1/3/4